MSDNVGIVIVSHSPDVAHCGGDPGGGIGTSVENIIAAIESAWSDKGVAVMFDLGGAESNSQMAIEMLPPEKQAKIVLCNAPIVEGSVIAATEAWGGGTLEEVKRSAEEFKKS
jgi:phosphoenolpyruvate---glycerone phosphotransferase subunit DhaM